MLSPKAHLYEMKLEGMAKKDKIDSPVEIRLLMRAFSIFDAAGGSRFNPVQNSSNTKWSCIAVYVACRADHPNVSYRCNCTKGDASIHVNFIHLF